MQFTRTISVSITNHKGSQAILFCAVGFCFLFLLILFQRHYLLSSAKKIVTFSLGGKIKGGCVPAL